MTVVLVAVYVPIGFQGGLTGALFTEFAFTLAGAVTVSAIVALTLSPMMCSRLLQAAEQRPRAGRHGSTDFIDRSVRSPAAPLRAVAARQPRLPAGDVGVRADRARQHLFPLCRRKSELAPQEDQGVVISLVDIGAERDAAADAVYSQQIYRDLARLSGDDQCSSSTCPGRSIAGMVLKPWDQRTRSHDELQPIVQQKMARSRARGRRLPAAAAAGQPGTADSVRHRHDRPVRAPQRRGAEVSAGGAQERHVHLSRYRSEDRQAAGHGARSTATRPRSSA